MTKTINNRKNMTTQELEAVSGGVVPWAAISVGIAAAKLTYDLVKVFHISWTLFETNHDFRTVTEGNVFCCNMTSN